MKKVLSLLTKFLLIIWQLPQIIVGGILFFFSKKIAVGKHKQAIISYCPWMKGGVTIGPFIFVSQWYYEYTYRSYNEKIVKHEYGHTIQSRIFGPFYILGLGYKSLIHAVFHKDTKNHTYEDFWTEKWANKLSEKYY